MKLNIRSSSAYWIAGIRTKIHETQRTEVPWTRLNTMDIYLSFKLSNEGVKSILKWQWSVATVFFVFLAAVVLFCVVRLKKTGDWARLQMFLTRPI